MAGWLNVDGFDESYPYGSVRPRHGREILSLDLTDCHPFPDDHFRYGYAEDFLEHRTQAESLIFLFECFRTLRPGGVLRLSFPDLAHVLERHYRTSDYDGTVTGQREAYSDWQHEHFYSFESLDFVARHIGFRDVYLVEFGQSDHEALRRVDTRAEQIGLNLIVELVK